MQVITDSARPSACFVQTLQHCNLPCMSTMCVQGMDMRPLSHLTLMQGSTDNFNILLELQYQTLPYAPAVV